MVAIVDAGRHVHVQCIHSEKQAYLDSCIVITELDDRGSGIEVPDVQLIVIASAGYFPVIRRPLQATHLDSTCQVRAAVQNMVHKC